MLCWYCNVCLTEHRPQVAPQSLPQPPQAWVQRKGPLEGTPPCKAFPRETLKPTPPSAQPPPGMKGPWGQPHPLIRPAVLAPATGCPKGPPPSQELVASGAQGPRGVTPPISQAESSSPAPSGKIKGIKGLKCLFFQIFQPLVVLLLLFMSLELCMLRKSSHMCLKHC
jgi:Uncharacterized protein conserved in bacteria